MPLGQRYKPPNYKYFKRKIIITDAMIICWKNFRRKQIEKLLKLTSEVIIEANYKINL